MPDEEKTTTRLTSFRGGGVDDDGKLVRAVFGDEDNNEYILLAPPVAIDQMSQALQEMKLQALENAKGSPIPGKTAFVRFAAGEGNFAVMEVKAPDGVITRYPLNRRGFRSLVKSLKAIRNVVQRYRAMKQNAPEYAIDSQHLDNKDS